jgi:hypothetical protein
MKWILGHLMGLQLSSFSMRFHFLTKHSDLLCC